MINVFFIKSLEEKYINQCLSSFKKTLGNENLKEFKINIVEELKTREKTLNKILQLAGFEDDLLIVADDIIFTKNWYENLIGNYENGDIIGFSMRKPKSTTISNKGFEFVKINGKISYLPIGKGEEVNNQENGFRICDFVTGCCMFINKEVLKKKFDFTEDGFNRWGEIIYSKYAKDFGFKVICLNHVLEHYSKSTKNKGNKLSSTSYLIEQKLWEKVVKNHLENLNVKKELKIEIGKDLKELIENKEKKLIYGAGFVTDSILTICKYNNVEIASGLTEEWGFFIQKIKVNSILNKNLKNFDKIIITAIGYEDFLKDKYFKEFEIIKLEKIVKNNTMFIDLKKDKDK